MAETITTILLMVIGTAFAAFGGYVIFSKDDDKKPSSRKTNRKSKR